MKLSISICLLSLTVMNSFAQSNINLNKNITFQTIDGWEVTGQAGQIEASSQYNQVNPLIWDKAVNELGINRVRLEISSGAENPTDYFQQVVNHTLSVGNWVNNYKYQVINDNNDAGSLNSNNFHFTELDYWIDNGILQMQSLLAANNEHLFINVCYVDFKASAYEHYSNPSEYAEFVLAVYDHMQAKYGFLPDSWETILEPDNSSGWSGVDIGKCIDAASDTLIAHGYTPVFVAPSTLCMNNAVPIYNTAASIGNAQSHIKELSYHRYCGVSVPDMQNIASTAKSNGIKTSHLEHIGANVQELYDDLYYANVSSWSQYTMAWPVSGGADDGGKYYLLDDTDPSNVTIKMGNRTPFLRQYFRYIRSGAIRIDATTSDNNLRPLAFINKNGDWVVVVYTANGATFTINNLPPGTYGINYSDINGNSNTNMPDQTINSNMLTTGIPNAGVITIYGKNALKVESHLNKTGVSIHPNPAKQGEALILTCEHPTNNYTIKIVDITGREIMSASMTGTMAINTDTLKAGIYFINVSAYGRSIETKKVVIE